MSRAQRRPYTGTRRKLVVAFDVGTTFSGASYAILEPGQPPEIHGVTQFPGQQQVGGDCKIPSVIYYDSDGEVVAIGSETDTDINPDIAQRDDLSKAEWFKLHLRPPRLAADQGFDVRTLPPLPRNKSAVDVFADVLRYLFDATKRYIRERQGVDLWNSVQDDIQFILSHPNGWEGQQQAEMRRAALLAGLVKNQADAADRVVFVTEGEASLHFCLNKVPAALEEYTKDGVLVVDCGGGTIDISAYTLAADRSLKEITPAECLLQGSIFVTKRASDFMTEKLRESSYGNTDDIATMTKFFDKKTKTSFKSPSKPSFIRFGRASDNEPNFDIRAGSIKLTGEQVASFFEPAVKRIIGVIEEQCNVSPIPIRAICLVGGFATSDYLFSSLNAHFSGRNLRILRPDGYLNKAVAEGAVSYHIDHRVSTRVARFTYGIEVTRPYSLLDPEHTHIRRRHLVYTSPSGMRRIEGIFSDILLKGTAVSEETEFRKTYFHEIPLHSYEGFTSLTIALKGYRGRATKPPAWIDSEEEFFEDNCEVTADLTSLKRQLTPQRRGDKAFYRFELDVILLFGLTELRAQIAWKQNGIERRGPASVVYDTMTVANDY